MKMKIKYKKTTNLFRKIKANCSTSILMWCIIGSFALFHIWLLLSNNIAQTDGRNRNFQSHPISRPHYRELEEMEEENLQIPPPRKRSARAVKRKPKVPSNIIEEFLDENSQLRDVFFPRTAIDPSKNSGNGSLYYHPGKIWLDTDGKPIQAHGGGLMYDERSKTYYWYGEYKDGPTYYAHKKAAARVDIIGVGCYSSKDLWAWKNEGLVLQAEEFNQEHDLYVLNVLERPKVIHNDRTGKYVMWMHIDDVNYTRAAAGVAISDHPTGPFKYLGSRRPHGCESRDMTLFKDDDGTAYLVYSSETNQELHVGPLTADYLDVTNVMGRILVDQKREAPAVFKHQGIYYMVTSGCTGWSPNEAFSHAAESMMGPWEILGNPCVGGSEIYRTTTFFSQSTFVLPVKDLPGVFIFMADRWNPAELKDSRYVWLPLIVGGPADRPLDYNFGFPVWSRVAIYWHRKWRLPAPRSSAD